MASDYPGAIDSAASLCTPVDAFSSKPLETTATGAVLAGDSTISVASTSGGFAASYGVLSIDDELIVYTAKTATQFTGCQRGAFGTAAAAHNDGAAVKANMVAGFITALQSAVLAVENELGTAAARNYVRKDGAVTVTGLKTFQDGAEFGSGAKAATGLVRLPNAGAIKWRKADGSGDLGMELNASNHLAMDAIIDFAPGQTFGSPTYPDATTTSKGIVEIDAVGGLDVNAGVVSLAATGVTPGTYTKTTVDAKGRVTAGALLAAADLPAHTHVAADIVSGSMPFRVQKAGTDVGTRRGLNLIEGSNVTLTVTDDPGGDRVDVTIAAAGGSANHNLLSTTHSDSVAASPVLGDLIAANGTPAWARLAGNTTTTRKFLRQTGTGSASALPEWDTLVAGDLPAHTHAEADVTGLAADLAGKAASVHTHTSSEITDATAYPTASTVVLRDAAGGASFAYAAANNLWAFEDSHFNSVECGPFCTVGGAFENMAKYSEDFSVAAWDKNGGTCTVSANSVVAPDGNQTADAITASGGAGLIRQNIAGLVANGQYTFYVWLKVPSGTMTVSIGILDNGWTTWLAGPTAVTLTTSWQRFKIIGTMTGGATSLWIAIGHYTDGWTSGEAFHAWGACLQQGNDPKRGYARTWGYQAGPVAAGVACGSLLVVGKDANESPLKVRGPGSSLADHTLLEVLANGELLVGSGYRLAEIVGASSPSGWSGCLKVKNPAGVTAGYILLYSNP
ncbi:MAG: hypothetical protein IT167_14635 [Bryobacterales bacterium]|nr:hypothetical protein [Bryobacterales bacterium]